MLMKQVVEIVAMVPVYWRQCQQPVPGTPARRRARVWRHQVVELLPLALRVTEYQMAVRRYVACGKRTRADLPAGVSRRPFGARLTAVVALLSGRYRLSRREVRQLLQDLWAVRASRPVLRAPQTGLRGPGRPRWGGRARWALGGGGDRTPLCAVASVPRRGVRARRVAATADPAPGPAGAATTAWAGQF